MTDEELAELRALQARAYGVGGGLVGAELARLRDLERLHRVVRGRPALPRPEADAVAEDEGASAVGEAELYGAEVSSGRTSSHVGPSTGSGSGGGRSGSGRGGSAFPLPELVEGEAASSFPLPERVEGEAASAVRRSGWRRTAVVASVAGAVMLVAGIAIGAVVSAPKPTVLELTEAQQELQHLIEEDEQFLAGSVRAVAVEEEAAAWIASSADEQMLCLIIGAERGWSSSCDEIEHVHANGIAVMHELPGDDDVGEAVQVQVMFTADGEVAVNLHRFTTGPPAEPFFVDEQERADHDALVGAGFTSGEMWTVGGYRGRSVWVAYRNGTQCLATVTDQGPAYGCQDTDPFGRMALTFPPSDPEADPLIVVTMEYVVDEYGRSSLVVTEAPAESTTIDVETGQPIGTGDQVDLERGLTGP